MDMYGVWSGAAGGFIADQMTKGEAEDERGRLIAEDDEDGEDLTVLPQCGEHPDYPGDTCDECDAEEPDGEE